MFEQTVLETQHYTDRLFRFRMPRPQNFRFRSGEFVTIGLPGENGKPLLRAYSIASPAWEDNLEFFSIKVPNGPLTSRLQNIGEGDTVILGKKSTGTLVLDALKPGKTLYLLSTGTGLAPFLSITRDPEVYERFDEVVLVHGVRQKNDLAYYSYFTEQLPNDEYMGELIKAQLTYLPTVTREPFERQGRITELIADGTLPLDPAIDRVMLCGSQSMLQDVSEALDALGFVASPSQGTTGDYVIERAFVEQ